MQRVFKTKRRFFLCRFPLIGSLGSLSAFGWAWNYWRQIEEFASRSRIRYSLRPSQWSQRTSYFRNPGWAARLMPAALAT